MKRFLLVLALVSVAGATYVATAPGGQTASPTAKQFKALVKQVKSLKKQLTVVEFVAILDTKVLTDCMATAVPVKQSGDTAAHPATYGYSYTDPNVNSGAPGFKTALDLTAADDQSALWMTGGTTACKTDINGPAFRKAARMQGLRLHAAPRRFSAAKR